MQLEAKTNLLVVTELVSILEVQGHPAISSSCSLGKEIKLPAWTMILMTIMDKQTKMRQTLNGFAKHCRGVASEIRRMLRCHSAAVHSTL